MDLLKSFVEKNMPEKAAPDITVGDTVRVEGLCVSTCGSRKATGRESRSSRAPSSPRSTAASTRPSPCAASPMASVWRRSSPSTAPSSKRWRPSARVRSAGPSCTICATAWARQPRSRRSCNFQGPRKRERGCAPFFAGQPSPLLRQAARGKRQRNSPLFWAKAFSDGGKSCILSQL